MAAIVLIVDDDIDVLNALPRLLKNQNDIRVLTAHSATEGMNFLELEEIAVIVSDYFMPDISGIDFLAKVKIVSPDTTRILMTGNPDLKIALNAINTGEVFRLTEKPWKKEDFVNAVLEGIERNKLLNTLLIFDEETIR